MEANFTLQRFVANLTHRAIAANVEDLGIIPRSFHIDFHNVSGVLSITQTLCASTEAIMSTLSEAIVTNHAQISSEFERILMLTFPDGARGDNVITRISKTAFASQSIYLQITRFDGFTADKLRNDSTLQDSIANMTYHAVANSASKYGLESWLFWIDYKSAENISHSDFVP